VNSIRHKICQAMYWFTIPLTVFFEYQDHIQPIPKDVHIYIQITILGIILSWVWFWNNRIEQIDLDVELQQLIEDRDLPGYENEK
jgi:hypothetical protein